jgi:pyruvate dehydrogenase E2 component (dihydrolipoamide acetyltransferase)
LEIKAQEDETVEVGAVLAVIGEPGDAEGAPRQEAPAPAEEAAEAPAQETPPEEQPTEAPAQEAPQETRTDEAAEAPAQEAPQETRPAAPDEPAETKAEPERVAAAPNAGADGSAGATEVTLPGLGESVSEGTVSRWLKQVGESVNADEPLLEVSTDKVDTEIPSPASGTLLEIRVQEDETVEVGAVLAVIGEAGAAAATPAPEAPPQPEAAPKAAPEPAPEEPEPARAREPQHEPEQPQPQEPQPEPAQPPAAREPQREPARPESAEPKVTAAAAKASDAAAAARAGADSDTTYVTPLVRKLAKEHGIDLASLNGTGVGGRIRKQDVLAAAEAAKQAAAAPAPEAPAELAATAAPAAATPVAEVSTLRGTTEKMTRLRQTIARRMVESLQVSAQLTATVEVDMTAISGIRAKVKDDFKRREGATLSYLPFIAKAAVEALKAYPKLNATIDTEQKTITYPDAEHLGIAVQTERGLLVPVIKDAGDLNISGLAKRIADLAARTRQNKVTPDELTGGTFTITNYGSAGTLMDTPIINQPQVGILGTGALVKRPVVITDERLGQVIAIRDMMYLSLSYDHRLVDGAEAAQFLSTLKARLEEGDFGAEFGL